MLTVKDRVKPVVERATGIVKHKSRYRRGEEAENEHDLWNYTAGHSQTDASLFHLGAEKKDDILLWDNIFPSAHESGKYYIPTHAYCQR